MVPDDLLAPFSYRIARSRREEILESYLPCEYRIQVQRGSRGMARLANAALNIHEQKTFAALLDNLSQGMCPVRPLSTHSLPVQGEGSQQRRGFQARPNASPVLRR